MEGNERSTNKHLKVLYIGLEQNKSYITRIVFDNIEHETYLGKKFFWNLYYYILKNRYKCSIAIIDGIFLDRYIYGTTKDFYIPAWVGNIVSLPLIATRGSAKRDLQKVRNNKIEYFVTKDTEMLHDFYFNMYRPMIRERYQNEAFEVSYNKMLEKYEEGCYELLLIKKQNILMSGSIINECEEVPRLWKNGIRDFKYWKEGAMVATYVYASEYLWEKGYKKLSFGGMRAFLNDGLLQYKRSGI